MAKINLAVFIHCPSIDEPALLTLALRHRCRLICLPQQMDSGLHQHAKLGGVPVTTFDEYKSVAPVALTDGNTLFLYTKESNLLAAKRTTESQGLPTIVA